MHSSILLFVVFMGVLGWGWACHPATPHPLRTKKSAPRIERGPKLCYTTIMVCPAKGHIGL